MEQESGGMEPQGREISSQIFAPLNVLVADDIASVRQLICRMLRHLGVRGLVAEAADGQEAWRILLERPFDVVVCDVNMPTVNGLELLSRLRAHPRYRHTPFLFITGEVSEELVAAFAESELEAYLMKPFKLSSLEFRLRSLLVRREHPGWGETLFRQALQLKHQGHPARALEVLEKLTQPPFVRQPRVYNLMGECYHQLGNLPRAAACFRQALEINPRYLKASQNLAALLMETGNPAEAAFLQEEVAKFCPLGSR